MGEIRPYYGELNDAIIQEEKIEKWKRRSRGIHSCAALTAGREVSWGTQYGLGNTVGVMVFKIIVGPGFGHVLGCK